MCGCGGQCGGQQQVFERWDDHDDTLGFDWGGIIGAGTNFGLNWLSQQGQGGQQQQGICGQTQLDDDGPIAVCLDQVIPQLMASTANMPTAAKLAAYEQFLAFMTNPQYFRQGASAHYLGNQIRQFRDDLIPQLRTQLAAELAAGQSTIVTDPATGQPVAIVPTTSTIGGIDTQTLLIVACGALGLMLITRG